MILAIECVVLCLIMFLICFLGTGSDIKNLRSLRALPKETQDQIRKDPELSPHIKEVNPIITFVSNLILFTIILFIFGIFIRQKGNYLYGFVGLLILGEVANAFDFFIVDMIWFRNTKRVRFSKFPDKELYKGLKEHFYSFLRGGLMFFIASAIDSALLFLF